MICRGVAGLHLPAAYSRRASTISRLSILILGKVESSTSKICTMSRRLFLSVVLSLILLSPIVAFADFTGRVVGVTDGDTIKVMHNGKAEKIRLHGIDCPEKAQPFGTKAKQFTSAMVFGKMVRVLTHGRDRYGRTVGDVILPDGTNMNQALVKVGLAWWYRQYAPHDDTLRMLEDKARKDRRGLWTDPHPIPPWCWRKMQKGRAC